VNRTILLDNIDPTGQVWTEELQRQYEKDSIGFALTCSQLNRHQPTSWDDTNENQEISVPCIISEVKKTTDKNGREMAFLNIETPSEFISGVMFNSIYNIYKRILFDGKYCMLHGKKNKNSLIVDTLSAL
jgi:DNA polymerase III alpha subunit